MGSYGSPMSKAYAESGQDMGHTYRPTVLPSYRLTREKSPTIGAEEYDGQHLHRDMRKDRSGIGGARGETC